MLLLGNGNGIKKIKTELCALRDWILSKGRQFEKAERCNITVIWKYATLQFFERGGPIRVVSYPKRLLLCELSPGGFVVDADESDVVLRCFLMNLPPLPLLLGCLSRLEVMPRSRETDSWSHVTSAGTMTSRRRAEQRASRHLVGSVAVEQTYNIRPTDKLDPTSLITR